MQINARGEFNAHDLRKVTRGTLATASILNAQVYRHICEWPTQHSFLFTPLYIKKCPHVYKWMLTHTQTIINAHTHTHTITRTQDLCAFLEGSATPMITICQSHTCPLWPVVDKFFVIDVFRYELSKADRTMARCNQPNIYFYYLYSFRLKLIFIPN